MYLSKLVVRGLRASAESELQVELPGRFSVLVGANGAGKTTVADAAYLAHGASFPRLPRLSASGLGPSSAGRSIEVAYSFEASDGVEGPLGRQIQAQSTLMAAGAVAATWSKQLVRDLGTIRTMTLTHSDLENSVRLIYLPAWRNPLDELARREARILVELLRAQQQNATGSRNLSALRARASGLLESLAKDGLISAVEDRISNHLGALSAGVSQKWPFVRGQVVDDTYLARVLELMLAVVEDRVHAMPLEVSGLGYVNLLHIAVTLAAIPDSSGAASTSSADGDIPGAETVLDGQVVDEEARLAQAQAERESEEDSFFTSAPFHATIAIEEPEAHLHPQLQHSLVRYLRRVVKQRPELQVILSSHAPDVIASCRPEDLVVMRQLPNGRRIARPVARIPLPETERTNVLHKARLHMDASRSSALFAERLVLVEGVTDAAVLREFGWCWAGDDAGKQAFVDALGIVPIGAKVGQWPVQLLATPGHELCLRLAVLRDSDLSFADSPKAVSWMAGYDDATVRMFQSHPTLEPAITTGNEVMVAAALQQAGLDVPDPVSAEEVHRIFRSAKKGTAAVPATPAGPGAGRKAEFALALAEQLEEARIKDVHVSVPGHIGELYEFLFSDPEPDSAPSDTSAPDEPWPSVRQPPTTSPAHQSPAPGPSYRSTPSAAYPPALPNEMSAGTLPPPPWRTAPLGNGAPGDPDEMGP